MSYGYSGYDRSGNYRKARSRKSVGQRSALSKAAGAGSDQADVANPGDKEDSAFSAALGKAIKGMALGPFSGIVDKMEAKYGAQAQQGGSGDGPAGPAANASAGQTDPGGIGPGGEVGADSVGE